jgi:hypothetical protein
LTALFNQEFSLKFIPPLIFKVGNPGGDFDACGYYVSFQNGEWILREVQCILLKTGSILKLY